jgi:hypothetical protein
MVRDVHHGARSVKLSLVAVTTTQYSLKLVSSPERYVVDQRPKLSPGSRYDERIRNTLARLHVGINCSGPLTASIDSVGNLRTSSMEDM